MIKSIFKKFLDFKNRHSLSNETIAKMISEYANSELSLARTFFKEKYGISSHTFYKARDYAVIFGLIDNKTCQMLRTKTAANYRMNNSQNTARASLIHFEELISERQKVVNTFTENEIKDIGYKYLSDISISKIAIAYDVGEYVIRLLLCKGIVELIFNRDTVNELYKRAGTSLNGYLKKRERNKKALLECFELQIKALKQRLNCYNAYVRFSKDVTLKEELEKKLSDAMELYNKALML